MSSEIEGLTADRVCQAIENGRVQGSDRGVAAAAWQLKHGRDKGMRPLHVMLLDDAGHAKRLPVNETATKLYHANCKPGTTHVIRGDVVVVPDDDFAEPATQLPVQA